MRAGCGKFIVQSRITPCRNGPSCVGGGGGYRAVPGCIGVCLRGVRRLYRGGGTRLLLIDVPSPGG